MDLFKAVFEHSPVGIAVTNLDGSITEANSSLGRIIGFSRAQLIKSSLFDHLHPDDIDQCIAQSLKILKGDLVTITGEHRLMHKNEKIVFCIITMTGLRNEFDDITSLLIQFMDITIRKETENILRINEQEFREIFEDAPYGIAKVAMDGRFLMVNKALCDKFEYSKQELKNLKMADISHPNDLKINLEFDRQLIRGDKDSFQMEKRYYTKRKKIIHTLLRVKLIKDKQGNQRYFLGHIVDISPLKNSEDILARKNLELIKINKELDNFVYKASHDLKGPLATLKGLFNIIEKDSFNDQFLPMMKHTTDKLNGVINEIDHFSYNLKHEVSSVNINYQQLVEETINNFKKEKNFRKIIFRISSCVKNPEKGDPKRLRLILGNIIHNAILYHDVTQKDPFINVSVIKKNNMISLRISDNGKGIERDHINSIFDMFYRGSEISRGSGLGLYVVKETVNKMNGAIKFMSKAGKGTSFDVTLPL